MGSSSCSTGGTANPATDMHDEWQSGERRYLSEGSMARLKPTSDTGGIAATNSGDACPAECSGGPSVPDAPRPSNQTR